jgi:hypothetical protein
MCREFDIFKVKVYAIFWAQWISLRREGRYCLLGSRELASICHVINPPISNPLSLTLLFFCSIVLNHYSVYILWVISPNDSFPLSLTVRKLPPPTP